MSDPLSLCHNQVMAFFRDLDENRYDDLVRRLAPDGVWLRQGQTLAGRDAVLAALAPLPDPAHPPPDLQPGGARLERGPLRDARLHAGGAARQRRGAVRPRAVDGHR